MLHILPIDLRKFTIHFQKKESLLTQMVSLKSTKIYLIGFCLAIISTKFPSSDFSELFNNGNS